MRRIWDGSNVAQELLERVCEEVVRIQRTGHPPPLLADVQVGKSPMHERLKALHTDACRLTGVSYQLYALPQVSDHQTIFRTLALLNADPAVSGITIHALPSTFLRELAAAIAPEKDVDGLHPLHLGRFVTNKGRAQLPRGADIIYLLKHAGLTLMGAHVICIGNTSGLADILALLSLHENATVSVCRGAAWPVDLLHRGDVLLIDTDDLPVVNGATLKRGVVVVDARHYPAGWMFHQPEDLPEAVSLLIPVPGGIGPTTIAMRLSTLTAISRPPASVQFDS